MEIRLILYVNFAAVRVFHFEVIMNSNTAFDIVQDIILALHGRISELEMKYQAALHTIEVYESIEKDMEKTIAEWKNELAKLQKQKG